MGIDEFSLKLGSLEAKHESTSDQLTILNNKIDKVLDKLTLMNGSIGKAHNRIDDIEPDVQDWKTTKKRAVLGVIGLSAAGGASGGFLGKLIAIFNS